MKILTKLGIKEIDEAIDEKLVVGSTHRHGWKNVLNIMSKIQSDLILIDYIDHFFEDVNGDETIKEWIGFWHYPITIPSFLHVRNNVDNIIKNNKFQKWIKKCKIIFVFSDILKGYLEKKLT